jgi:hypothetical protein
MPGRTRNLGLRLKRTLTPKSRPALVTLGDAAHYISELPEARRKEPQWAHAVAVLDRAATTGDENDIALATHAVAVALATE